MGNTSWKTKTTLFVSSESEYFGHTCSGNSSVAIATGNITNRQHHSTQSSALPHHQIDQCTECHCFSRDHCDAPNSGCMSRSSRLAVQLAPVIAQSHVPSSHISTGISSRRFVFVGNKICCCSLCLFVCFSRSHICRFLLFCQCLLLVPLLVSIRCTGRILECYALFNIAPNLQWLESGGYVFTLFVSFGGDVQCDTSDRRLWLLLSDTT